MGENAEVVRVSDAHRRFHDEGGDAVAFCVGVDSGDAGRDGGDAGGVGRVKEARRTFRHEVHRGLFARTARRVARGTDRQGDAALGRRFPGLESDHLGRIELQLRGRVREVPARALGPARMDVGLSDSQPEGGRGIVVVAVRMGVEDHVGANARGQHLEISRRQVDQDLSVEKGRREPTAFAALVGSVPVRRARSEEPQPKSVLRGGRGQGGRKDGGRKRARGKFSSCDLHDSLLYQRPVEREDAWFVARGSGRTWRGERDWNTERRGSARSRDTEAAGKGNFQI